MFRLQAPAKVNLTLHVVSKREDGYHDLVTRMQKIDLCDEIGLLLRKGPGIDLTCGAAELPRGEENLAYRAAAALLERTGLADRCGISIDLRKNIPMAAGLGGGSSDAGVVLKGMNRLLSYPLSEEDLLEVARDLGADVPFFTSDLTAALATGVGDRLSPAKDLDEYWYLLVNPGFSVSTKWVFDNYRLTTTQKDSTVRGSQISNGGAFPLTAMHNDLERVTIERYPAVGMIKNTLLDAGAERALMSGSGPTVFGLFPRGKERKRELKRLVEHLSGDYGKRVFLTRTYTGA